MSRIKFEKRSVVAKIRNPLNDFQLTSEKIEVRTDPLLGYTTRIVSPKGLDIVPQDDPLPDFVKRSQNCFFCEGRVETQTPMLPESIYAPGRIQVGEALLFPNLSGYGQYSGVCILSKEHFTSIEAFREEQIFDGLKACQNYFQLCAKAEEDNLYPTINWNYLLPAGSSLLHPHIQPILDPIPTQFHRYLLEASGAYTKKYESDFWEEIKECEREGSRVVYETENIVWFTPFAPLGFNEMNAIIGENVSFLDLNEDVLKDLAKGLVTLFRFYHNMKRNSFNLTLFSSPVLWGNTKSVMPCLLKVVTRPAFQPYYRSDITFFERFHQESVIDRPPEEVAMEYRAFISNEEKSFRS